MASRKRESGGRRGSDPSEEKASVGGLDYRAIFNAVSNGMAFTESATGNIIDVNAAWLKATGFDRDRSVGRTAFELGLWANPDERKACLALLAEKGRVADFEAVLIMKSRPLVHLISGETVEMDGGRYVLWEFRDIDVQKRSNEAIRKNEEKISSLLEASEQSRRALLSILEDEKSAKEALRESESRINAISKNFKAGMIYQVVIHPDGARSFAYLSDSVRLLYGVTPEEAMADSSLIYRRVHPDDVASLRMAEDGAAKTLSPFVAEPRVRNTDGSYRWSSLASTLRPMEDGSIVCDGIEFIVTERKQAELLLRLQHDLFMELNSCQDLLEGLGRVLSAVLRLDCVDCGGIYLANPVDGSLDLVVHQGLSDEFIAAVSHVDADSTRARLVAIGDASYGTYPEVEIEPDDIRAKEELRAYAILPIVHQGKPIAVLNLASHRYETIPVETRITLETIAVQVAGALLRLRTNEALKESEEIFGQFMKNSPIYVFFKDEKARPVRLSSNYARMLGRPVEELLGKTMDDFFPSDLAKQMIADDLGVLKEGKPLTIEEEFDGRVYSTVKFPISIGGKPRFLSGYTIDITDRKRAEEENRSLLQEKTILLKEVHHRIKNNIASIEGLLRLQADDIKNPEALSLIKIAVGRIQSMRVLYENLLVSENYLDISTKDYFERLIASNVALFPYSDRIRVEREISDFSMNTKILVPLGIIVNELVTNAMKYAFTGGNAGVLRVVFSRTADTVTMIVADDGIGLPEGLDVARSNGFGYKLVDMMIKQIGASYKIESDRGTRFTIEYTMS